VKEELARAATTLARAERVAIACHVNPDADAIGSMLGLANYLRGRGTDGQVPESHGLYRHRAVAGP